MDQDISQKSTNSIIKKELTYKNNICSGVPIWTNSGVKQAFYLGDIFFDLVKKTFPNIQYFFPSNFINKKSFLKYYKEYHDLETQMEVDDYYIMSSDSLINVFSHLWENKIFDSVNVGLSSCYRKTSKPVDLFKDKNLWPCYPMNIIDTKGIVSFEIINEIYKSFFNFLGIEIISIISWKKDYGTCLLHVAQLKNGCFTALSMVFQLGERFTKHWNRDFQYFNSGFTEKVIYLTEYSHLAVNKEINIKSDFDFYDNSLMEICDSCIRKYHVVKIGNLYKSHDVNCGFCNKKTEVKLVSKANNFY